MKENNVSAGIISHDLIINLDYQLFGSLQMSTAKSILSYLETLRGLESTLSNSTKESSQARLTEIQVEIAAFITWAKANEDFIILCEQIESESTDQGSPNKQV